MPIPASANYNPPRINRYVPGMKYDANVGADGLTRMYFEIGRASCRERV